MKLTILGAVDVNIFSSSLIVKKKSKQNLNVIGYRIIPQDTLQSNKLV